MNFRAPIFSALLAYCTTIAPYTNISSLAEIQQHIKPDTTTVVFLDLDHTLVRSVMHSNWFAKLSFIVWPPSEYKDSNLWDRMHFAYALIPHEKDTFKILNEIKEHNIPVIGLTARPPVVADRTLEQFQALDFTFSQSTEQESVVLTNGVYKKGIIFCGPNDKGVVLTEFLTATQLKPETIIFVDDLRKNVKAVERAAQQLNITCCAFHIA